MSIRITILYINLWQFGGSLRGNSVAGAFMANKNTFEPTHRPRCMVCRNVLADGSSATEGFSAKPIASNFWGTVVDKIPKREKCELPFVPTLDKNGPLPHGAYTSPGDPTFEPKEVCRIPVCLDIPEMRRTVGKGEISTSVVVRRMQEFIDSGFTSFQVKATGQEHRHWAEENILGRLRQASPAFVMNKCELRIPLKVPPANSAVGVQASSVRKSLLESLHRVGGDALDCVQIQHDKNSPYIFDVLENLEELKRDGLVRSVCGCNIPALTVRTMNDYGFRIDSNQLDVNMLNPDAHSMDQALLSEDLHVPIFWSSALAGGLLTNRYNGVEVMPKLWQLRLAERRQWNTNLPIWADRQGYTKGNLDQDDKWIWDAYQLKLLSALEQMAQKHGVSISSVMLRWSLQQDHVASVPVTCRLVYPDDGLKRVPRQQELREVFRFKLDDDDVEELWGLSGRKSPEAFQGNLREPPDSFFSDEMIENESGLMLPGSHRRDERGNQKLWL